MGADRVQGSGAGDGPRTHVGRDLSLPVGFGSVPARSADAVGDEDCACEEEYPSGQDDHVGPRSSSEGRECTGTVTVCYAAPPRCSGARIRCGGGPERQRRTERPAHPSGSGRPERRRTRGAAGDPAAAHPSGGAPERRRETRAAAGDPSGARFGGRRNRAAPGSGEAADPGRRGSAQLRSKRSSIVTLCPRGDEVTDELLLCVGRRVDLLVQVRFVRPAVQRREPLLAGAGATASVLDAIRAGRVSAHPDEQRAVVVVVGRPPVLRRGHDLDDVPLQRLDIEILELLRVPELLAQRVGAGGVLAEDLQVELVRPPVLIGPGSVLGRGRGGDRRVLALRYSVGPSRLAYGQMVLIGIGQPAPAEPMQSGQRPQ